MRWALGLSFIAMAAWMLVPDKLDDSATRATRFGVFGTTLIAFFLVEMGDKTQIATVALAARYDALVAVVAGTTIGMLLANVPAVLLGQCRCGKAAETRDELNCRADVRADRHRRALGRGHRPLNKTHCNRAVSCNMRR